MSHIVAITTEVRDPVAVAAACHRLGLAPPVPGTAQFSSGAASGLLVQLPGWVYPAVIDTATARIAFDHFEGAWGDPRHLDSFLQSYAVEKARLEARKRGHQVVEHSLADGSIRLTIQVGGGAS
jgi:hypothetical protein